MRQAQTNLPLWILRPLKVLALFLSHSNTSLAFAPQAHILYTKASKKSKLFLFPHMKQTINIINPHRSLLYFSNSSRKCTYLDNMWSRRLDFFFFLLNDSIRLWEWTWYKLTEITVVDIYKKTGIPSEVFMESVMFLTLCKYYFCGGDYQKIVLISYWVQVT